MGLAIGCLGIVLAAGVVNVVVDPYAIFGTPRWQGVNAAKPYAGDRGRVAKIHQAIRVRPRGLIVGNSRPEMGLDPAHPCWPAEARPVYNVALPGLSFFDQVRYAQHAMAAGEVSTMVVAIDFLDFLNPPWMREDPHLWPPSEERTMALIVDENGAPRSSFARERLEDLATGAFSLHALADSLFTLLRQGGPEVGTRTPAGFNPARAFYLPIIREEGVGALFAQKNAELAERLSAADWSLHHAGSDWSSDLESLRRLLRQARAGGVEVRLLVNPYHAEYMVAIDLAGLWEVLEQWKREVVAIASAEGGGVLWDFNAFDAHATEAFDDDPGQRAALEWFWEPGHYRKALGDLILANLYREECAGSGEPRYGAVAEAENVESHLARLRGGLRAYARSHPEVVERLRALVPPGSSRGGSPPAGP